MLSRQMRLTKSRDFSRIYRRNRAVSSLHLRLLYSSADQNLPRFGFVVSKKHAARIVDRNRLKRILRSTIRGLEPSLTGKYDVIIQARPHVSKVPAKQIREELQILLEKAKLLKA